MKTESCENMDTRKATARRITALCQERHWKPYHLALQAGVPSSTVKNILNGTSRNPGIVTLKKLCDAFEITLTEFFDTEEFNNLEQELL